MKKIALLFAGIATFGLLAVSAPKAMASGWDHWGRNESSWNRSGCNSWNSWNNWNRGWNWNRGKDCDRQFNQFRFRNFRDNDRNRCDRHGIGHNFNIWR